MAALTTRHVFYAQIVAAPRSAVSLITMLTKQPSNCILGLAYQDN